TAITSAASLLPTKVSPGLMVAIFGNNLGPQTLVQGTVTAAGLLDTNIQTTRVFFDNIPAPMVYTRSDVVACMVPYEIFGRATVNVAVEYQGVRGQAISVTVADTAPSIFTLNQQGTGQAAIRNFPDFSINGPNNALPRGTGIAVMYITG